MEKNEMEELKVELLKNLKIDPRRVEVKLHTNSSFLDKNNTMLTALCHTWLAFFNEYYLTFLEFKSIRLVQKKHLPLVHHLFAYSQELYWGVNELNLLDELIQGVSIPCFKGSTRKINLDPKRIKLLLRYVTKEKTSDSISISDYLKESKTNVIYDYKDKVFAPLLEDGFINVFLGTNDDDTKKVFYSSFFILNENDINILIEFFSTAINIFLSDLEQGKDYQLVVRLVK